MCKVLLTKPIARVAARTMIETGRVVYARAYFCKQCNAWHVTHLTKKEYKEK